MLNFSKLLKLSTLKTAFKTIEFVFFVAFAILVTVITVLFSTGVLNSHKIDNSLSALKGKEFTEAAPQQPAQPDELDRAMALQNDALAKLKTQEEKFALIETLQNQINTKLTELTLREDKLGRDKAAFEENKAKFQKFIEETFPKADELNYASNLKIFSKMSAKEVAGMFSAWETPTVIRYLKGFKESFSADILTELRKSYKDKSFEVETVLAASTKKPEIK
ncbi:MAG: hypothetical protein HZA48_04565 [Planctomycetes bacterium]|nr:hypothetical protein [Planctomycetota bacterium]